MKIQVPRFHERFQDFKQDFKISSKISRFQRRFQLKCTRFQVRVRCIPLDLLCEADFKGGFINIFGSL